MPKKKSAAPDLEPKYSKEARHIIIACALLIFTGAIFLSTEPGQRMLGFDLDATGSSASQANLIPYTTNGTLGQNVSSNNSVGNNISCEPTYTGTIAGGSVVYHSTSGFSGRAGSYSGNLTSDSGAKLSLERKQGKNWSLVAQSPGFGTEEYLSYSGSKGTYRWKVAATSTTAYSLCANLP